MFAFIRNLFKKKNLAIDMAAATLPEALQYPEPQYNLLVNEMVNAIVEEDRFQTFANYLKTNNFKQYNLDIEKPRDTLILGYAFASAIMLKRSLVMHQKALQALEAFSPNNRKLNN